MVGETTAKGKYDGYARLASEVKRRWQEPGGHPTFGLFFVGSFLVFAAIGVWLELFKLAFGIGPESGSAASLRTAIATYFPAILGSSILQLMISETLRSLRALGYIISAIFGALALVLIFAVSLGNGSAIVLGLLASAAALSCWRIVYADDPTLRDEPEPQVATGKPDATAPLMGGDVLGEFEA